MTETPDPTAAIEVWARLLCAADVHVHDGDHPTWQQLRVAQHGRGQDDYRKAAAWLLPRMTVAAETRLSRAERRCEELRAESLRRGKTVLEYSEKIRALEHQIDEVRRQLGAEILRTSQAEAAVSSAPADRAAAELATARTTNQRLNYEKQRLEKELATYRRAVAQWEISDAHAYVPLRSVAAIAKAAGLDVPAQWEPHYQRAERAEAERDSLGREADRLRKDWVEMRTRAERAEADRAAVLDDEAALIELHCPDHSPQDQDGVWMDCHCAVAEDMRKRASELRRVADETPQPGAREVEDPARIDRLRPEFFEHASVEAIDSQIRRAQTQQRQWGNRARTLAILREARVKQKELGEWPAVGAQQPKEAESPRTVCVCGHTRAEHLVVGGRLLCDACDGLDADACKEFEAL